MGVNRQACEVLMYGRERLAVDFSRTLTLGRLQMFMRPKDLDALVGRFQPGRRNSWAGVTADKGFAEPLFMALGATSVDSMDYSDYEKASIIHDLNKPVKPELHGRFSCVVDGGTIEHVYNFPNAIQSCMEMVAHGGHYIGITPANNQMGHGFYQFSPELYFRLFAPENGFEVKSMLLGTNHEWFEVSDPKVMRERGQMMSSVALTLVVIARRIGPVPNIITPQQSDYVSAWTAVEAEQHGRTRPDEPAYRKLLRKLLPVKARTVLRNIAALFKERVQVEGIVGMLDTAHYKRVEL